MIMVRDLIWIRYKQVQEEGHLEYLVCRKGFIYLEVNLKLNQRPKVMALKYLLKFRCETFGQLRKRTMDKIKILIVDDHAILRAGLKMLIEKEKDMEVIG